MTAYIDARLSVTDAADEIRPFLGGSLRNIPIIEFGPEFSATKFEITVNSKTMTPAEQAAWLRRFALAAEDLAEQVERRAAEVANEALAVGS